MYCIHIFSSIMNCELQAYDERGIIQGRLRRMINGEGSLMNQRNEYSFPPKTRIDHMMGFHSSNKETIPIVQTK
uniref:Uncharacterized protein n=1 Tax=Solanum lycopersicum TaxID=4081 RepID=A0A3Q7I3D1_SOLLC